MEAFDPGASSLQEHGIFWWLGSGKAAPHFAVLMGRTQAVAVGVGMARPIVGELLSDCLPNYESGKGR